MAGKKCGLQIDREIGGERQSPGQQGSPPRGVDVAADAARLFSGCAEVSRHRRIRSHDAQVRKAEVLKRVYNHVMCDSRIAAGHARLEQLCRYINRPALSDERGQFNAAGQVELKLNTPWRDDTTHLTKSPLEFMQSLTAPKPRSRLRPRRTALRRPLFALG